MCLSLPDLLLQLFDLRLLLLDGFNQQGRQPREGTLALDR